MDGCNCPCCSLAEINSLQLKINFETHNVSVYKSVIVDLPDSGCEKLKERLNLLLEISSDNLKLLKVLLSDSQTQHQPTLENVPSSS
jgi:hypothetical protein